MANCSGTQTLTVTLTNPRSRVTTTPGCPPNVEGAQVYPGIPIPGPPGATGPPGQAATVNVGTTTTGAPGTPANVTNTGTPSAAIFDFTIPQGAVGPQGPQGDQGPPGDVTTGVASFNNRTGAVAPLAGDYTAAMVTNAVSTTGSYANPAWITSLAWAKITGAPATGVSSVFGRTGAVVALAGDYTAAQVTNAVSTAATYSDPAWITSLSYSKLTGAPPASPWQSGSGGAIYYNGGNVGVGVAAPATIFHAYKNQTATTWITVDNDNGGAGQGIGFNYGSQGRIGSILHSNPGGSGWTMNLGVWSNSAVTTVMTLTGTGNVGIGTTSPAANLDVNGFIRSTNLGNVPTAGQGIELYWSTGNGGNVTSYDRAASSFQPLTIQGSVISILQGPVGIGTSNPANLMHLVGAFATPSLRLGATNLGFYWDIGRENLTTGDFIFINANGAGASERMRITVAGNVGIGTTTPATEGANAKLAVLGVASQQASSVATSNTQALVTFRANSNSGYALNFGCESANSLPYLQTAVYNGGSASSHLLLNPWGGYVGIGTVSPSGVLHVNQASGGGYLIKISAPNHAYGLAVSQSSGAFLLDDLNVPVSRLSIDTSGNAQCFAGLSATGYVGMGITGVAGYPLQLRAATNVDLVIQNLGGALAFQSLNDALNAYISMNFYASAFNFTNAAVTVGAGTGASPGDIALARTSAPTTAAIFFGNAGKYISFDGSNWNFNPALPSSAITTQNAYGTSGRALNTVYQNTTGKPLFVVVNTYTSNGSNTIVYSDTQTTPTTVITNVGIAASGAGVIGQGNVPISFWVLPNYYYRVVGGTLNSWTEYY